ncbi:hypothetical protein [Halalkalibacter krulwichiae]|uniref:Uncharacterized protein n=1 Tax=Halalkalibacter krulwichiae TaxID=199441 RepID=A0A1X9MDQ4_9BACI|nr:hypothetical protein [Halalkalibacter krulwichiae]ARK31579.1 hypothetical protein BkAM31D_17970 [Halalkalibacter krulwichiae]
MRKSGHDKLKRLQECVADSNTEHEQKKLMTELAILTEKERIEQAEK